MKRKSIRPTTPAKASRETPSAPTTPVPAEAVGATTDAESAASEGVSAAEETVRAPAHAGAPPQETVTAASEPPSVTFTTVFAEQPVPHLLLRASGVVDESSVDSFFERASPAMSASKARRILVDLRDCNVVLSISDMHGLVKMAASGFAGLVDRLALVLREGDILPEKFFEPALTSRGLPTFATTDYDEALDWLAAKLRPGI